LDQSSLAVLIPILPTSKSHSLESKRAIAALPAIALALVQKREKGKRWIALALCGFEPIVSKPT